LDGDPDPLLNTATVNCTVGGGFGNAVSADSNEHSVDLFQAAVSIVKGGDTVSKVGDLVNYSFTATNDSSAGTPELTCSITDSLLGTVGSSFTLAVGASHTENASRTVLDGDPDPLLNTATVNCTVGGGFGNSISADSNQHSVDLLHPSFTVAKNCSNEPVPQDGPATWDVDFTNTGDVDLIITADDGIGTFTLGAGLSTSFSVSSPGPFLLQPTVSNTVTASWVLPAATGLLNTDTASASDTCEVASRVDLLKLTNGAETVTDVWNFEVYTGPDGFGGTLLASDSTPPALLTFGDIDLDPNDTYTICELGVNAGWSTEWMVDSTPVTPYNPDFPVDDGNRCVDFGDGTSWPLQPGGTLSFQVDNRPPPGGDARTPGYWRAWSSCTPGRQVETAVSKGGPTSGDRINAGYALLDDVLQDPGITIGLVTLIADADVYSCDPDTQFAVNLLDHRDKNGRKRANDAAYKLARSLLAYYANVGALTTPCPEAVAAADAGAQLLVDIGFTGVGSYLRPNHPRYQEAVGLAGTLDEYNNNVLCP
jgi:hypothetical protein